MKLNLGCGSDKRAGYVNADKYPSLEPDVVADLEAFPWPFDSDSAEEIVLSHVLEHLGADPAVFIKVMQELYRVSTPDAVIRIAVPHPRNDLFAMDPTHVRVVSPDGLSMFSKRQNRDWQARGLANSPLALIADVDFEITSAEVLLTEEWRNKVNSGEITGDQMQFALKHYFNVASEFRITLKAVK